MSRAGPIRQWVGFSAKRCKSRSEEFNSICFGVVIFDPTTFCEFLRKNDEISSNSTASCKRALTRCPNENTQFLLLGGPNQFNRDSATELIVRCSKPAF